MQFVGWHGQKSIEVIVRYFGFLGKLDSGLLEAIIATYGQCQPDSCFAIQICHNKTEQIWHRQSFWHGESSGFTSFKGKTVFESFLDKQSKIEQYRHLLLWYGNTFKEFAKKREKSSCSYCRNILQKQHVYKLKHLYGDFMQHIFCIFRKYLLSS